uniref:Uncharacterized protein n=1 Tax=Oryzias sinensis TaxID=183150 RepID=A0A8C7WSS6_9TELE
MELNASGVTFLHPHSVCVCVCVCGSACMYVRAAAGNAFCQAARLHMQLQNKLDSATSFVDAGNAYKKADPQGESTENIRAHECRRPLDGFTLNVKG